MITQIIRKGRPVTVKTMKIGDLDKNKLSKKLLEHNFNNDHLVNVKILPNGEFDLRGKKGEYRIIVEDNYGNRS
jgi:mRNA-degrading endonuclease RelE of RelBE toxin-antitoxin system